MLLLRLPEDFENSQKQVDSVEDQASGCIDCIVQSPFSVESLDPVIGHESAEDCDSGPRHERVQPGGVRLVDADGHQENLSKPEHDQKDQSRDEERADSQEEGWERHAQEGHDNHHCSSENDRLENDVDIVELDKRANHEAQSQTHPRHTNPTHHGAFAGLENPDAHQGDSEREQEKNPTRWRVVAHASSDGHEQTLNKGEKGHGSHER